MYALRLDDKWINVDTLEEASVLVRKQIDSTGVGSTDWYSHRLQGHIRQGGELVARVSYNGRIWPALTLDTNEQKARA